MVLPGIGFFGFGPLASIMLDILHKNGFKINAVWAPREKDARELAGSRSIPFFSSVIDKVLLSSGVQLIMIVCPPHYHHQIATKACGIGKHVVCNWPPSISVKEAIWMNNAAQNYPALITLFIIGLRFVPSFNLMRKLIIDDDHVGFVRMITANVHCDVISVFREMSDHWDRNLGGGLLSIYGTNLIDIISYITGYRATRVHGLVNSIKQLKSNPIFYSCTEDYVNFQMEMHPDSKNCTRLLTMKKAQSISATVILNGHFYNDQPKHEVYVYGTKGYLVCRDGDLYSFRFDSNNRATNSNLDHPHSLLSKTSYLASKETLLHSSLKISTMKKSSTTIANKMNESYVYPQIYLLGIKNMITALKNAFLIQTYRNDNPKHHNYLIQNPIEEFKLNYPYRERNLDSDLDYSSNDSQQHSDEHHHHFLSEKNENEYDWTKRPVDQAVNFEDGIYLQQVIEAIHISSQTKEWIRI